MQNRKTGENSTRDEVYIVLTDTDDTAAQLRALLEAHGYSFWSTTEESESFQPIQESKTEGRGSDTAPPVADELGSPEHTGTRSGNLRRFSRGELRGRYNALLGESDAHLRTLKYIDLFAGAEKTVLISGETGTGKELVARALHRESARGSKEMVVVNCGGISGSLMASELFGHEKGAFTGADAQRIGLFETAKDSTLFLDEIGELPLPLQPKLLRALQEGEIRRVGGVKQIPVNVRIIAATNRNLEKAVADGTFRVDLYERLKPIHILVPSLRERQPDIPTLARHFLAQERKNNPEGVGELTPNTIALLTDYPWPGNIRELAGVITYAAILSEGAPILPEHLPEHISETLLNSTEARRPSASETPDKVVGPVLPFPHGTTLQEIEQAALLETLEREGGKRAKAAAVLGISPPTLRAKLKTDDS